MSRCLASMRTHQLALIFLQAGGWMEWVGVPFLLKQPGLSSGSQVPAAPSICTAPLREGHSACPRDGHCVVTQARWTQGLPSLGTNGGSGTELCALWDSALYPDSGYC